MNRFVVQPTKGRKIDYRIANGGKESLVEAGVVAPPTGVGVDAKKGREELSREDSENGEREDAKLWMVVVKVF